MSMSSLFLELTFAPVLVSYLNFAPVLVLISLKENLGIFMSLRGKKCPYSPGPAPVLDYFLFF